MFGKVTGQRDVAITIGRQINVDHAGNAHRARCRDVDPVGQIHRFIGIVGPSLADGKDIPISPPALREAAATGEQR